MQRRKFSREFKLEAVKLVRERGVSVAQAARDLDLHENVLRKWVRDHAADPGSAFPGHGVMKPEQQEIERLRRELAKVKAERDILKKAAAYFREGLDMRFAFIAKHRGIWPVWWICETLGGLAQWLPCLARPRTERPRAQRRGVQRQDPVELRLQRSDLRRPPCLARSSAEGLSCGLHRIERLMRLHGLKARPRRRGLPKDDGVRSVIADNVLDRQFTADAPNQKWVADFTYIWTVEGWLYVAAVIDLFSRRVVGWSMSDTMTAQLVTDALMMAIWGRGKPDALLHHSDQGSQYTSDQFQRLMADNGITCSMSRSGCPPSAPMAEI